MKKTAIVLLALVSLSSCKKSYVCECTTNDGFGTNYSTREISKTSKKTAKAICGNSTDVYTSPASNSISQTTQCELK